MAPLSVVITAFALALYRLPVAAPVKAVDTANTDEERLAKMNAEEKAGLPDSVTEAEEIRTLLTSLASIWACAPPEIV